MAQYTLGELPEIKSMQRILAVSITIAFANSAFAQGRPEPLVKQVKTSIAKGVDNLILQQGVSGSWGNTDDPADTKLTNFSGGSTALAVLALLNCDGVIDDPSLEKRRLAAIDKGLKVLRPLRPDTVYVRALQTMAFAEAKKELAIVKDNAQWLIDARVFTDENRKDFIGWDYHSRFGKKATEGTATDASNSQYAMLALWYARQAGVEIKRDVWQSIHDYYKKTQHLGGSWGYSLQYQGMNKPSVTMTVAGICGLLISSSELNSGREAWPPAGKVKNCGEYPDDRALASAFQWLNGAPTKGMRSNFTFEIAGATYYHIYGLERAGRLSGMRFFGEHDWYREGCEYLVRKQNTATGAWDKSIHHDQWPHVNTSFALLFLSKGRTPVVISKLVHGKFPRDEHDTDWNNDRNDLRHLTEYVSRSDLFDKKALAWQIYDIQRSIESQGKRDSDAVVADMLQTPILYITGHRSPLIRFTDDEKALIKRYVQNGGFIFAEACCGEKAFDAGIKDLVQALWDGCELQALEATHPVWTYYHTVTPGDPFKLYGVSVGCRTVMIYSPQDLSCHWESNRYTEGATKRAFELGANIIAFGTGRTPPQPRLTPIDLVHAEKEIKRPSGRGFFEVRQLRLPTRDWQPAPRAMANLLEHVHKTHGLDVHFTAKTQGVKIKEAGQAKFLYMHGRDAFRFDKEQLAALRFNLENGGLLFADACCGKAEFDKSFRQFAEDLFPRDKLVRLSTEPTNRDRLFSAELNGEVLWSDNIKCRTKPSGKYAGMDPHLEGIQIDGRWVVLYSKYDLGCALERDTSADCLGYDHPSALRIATAAVLYNARP
jgi:hypothetical protein